MLLLKMEEGGDLGVGQKESTHVKLFFSISYKQEVTAYLW